jgi:hypothetical protein
LSAARKPAKRTRKSPQELLDAVQERLDATPERLARARESGQTPTRDADRTRRIIDPFDAMRQPGPGAARSEAQRHPLAGRRIPAPHPSARQARSIARGRARPLRFNRLRPPSRPAAIRDGALRPRQAARGRGPGRPPRLADCDEDRHRRGGRARLPRLHPRTGDALARRRGGQRPAQGRARCNRRAHGGDAETGKVSPTAQPTRVGFGARQKVIRRLSPANRGSPNGLRSCPDARPRQFRGGRESAKPNRR